VGHHGVRGVAQGGSGQRFALGGNDFARFSRSASASRAIARFMLSGSWMSFSSTKGFKVAGRVEKLCRAIMVILTCRRSPACRGVEAKAPDVLQRTAEPIPKQLKFSALARYSFPLVLDTVIDTGDDRDRDIH
jgi:hypothetical protein